MYIQVRYVALEIFKPNPEYAIQIKVQRHTS